VALGIGGQWLAWKLRIPAILVLLTSGCLFGGVLGLLKPDEVVGEMLQPLVSLAVGLILFEGGMTLKFSELRMVWRSTLGLLTVGVLVTWGLGTLAAHFLLGLPLAVLVFEAVTGIREQAFNSVTIDPRANQTVVYVTEQP
jgi:NhaP-type Na+/H+ or K+/H+ antiporter